MGSRREPEHPHGLAKVRTERRSYLVPIEKDTSFTRRDVAAKLSDVSTRIKASKERNESVPIEALRAGVDLTGIDEEDVEKAIQRLAERSDKGERFTTPETEWAKILETNRLKPVETSALISRMREQVAKRNFTIEESVYEAIRVAIDDPARKRQAHKVGTKIIFRHVTDKTLAAEVKKIFEESLY